LRLEVGLLLRRPRRRGVRHGLKWWRSVLVRELKKMILAESVRTSMIQGKQFCCKTCWGDFIPSQQDLSTLHIPRELI
jgi:hypothetical protein